MEKKEGSVSKVMSLPTALPGSVTLRNQERDNSIVEQPISTVAHNKLKPMQQTIDNVIQQGVGIRGDGDEDALSVMPSSPSLTGADSSPHPPPLSLSPGHDNTATTAAATTALLSAILDPLLEEFSPSSGPSMPRIEERIPVGSRDHAGGGNMKLKSIPATLEGSSNYEDMYDEEEMNLMEELVGLQTSDPEEQVSSSYKIAKSSNPTSQDHAKSQKKKGKGRKSRSKDNHVATNAIYPSELDEGDPSFDEEELMRLQVEETAVVGSGGGGVENDLATQSMSALDTKLHGLLLKSSNSDKQADRLSSSVDIGNNRPNSASNLLMSPSSSRRILNLVSGLMNRKNGCKVHVDDEALT